MSSRQVVVASQDSCERIDLFAVAVVAILRGSCALLPGDSAWRATRRSDDSAERFGFPKKQAAFTRPARSLH